jgi:hypothetical protein
MCLPLYTTLEEKDIEIIVNLINHG